MSGLFDELSTAQLFDFEALKKTLFQSEQSPFDFEALKKTLFQAEQSPSVPAPKNDYWNSSAPNESVFQEFLMRNNPAAQAVVEQINTEAYNTSVAAKLRAMDNEMMQERVIEATDGATATWIMEKGRPSFVRFNLENFNGSVEELMTFAKALAENPSLKWSVAFGNNSGAEAVFKSALGADAKSNEAPQQSGLIGELTKAIGALEKADAEAALAAEKLADAKMAQSAKTAAAGEAYTAALKAYEDAVKENNLTALQQEEERLKLAKEKYAKLSPVLEKMQEQLIQRTEKLMELRTKFSEPVTLAGFIPRLLFEIANVKELERAQKDVDNITNAFKQYYEVFNTQVKTFVETQPKLTPAAAGVSEAEILTKRREAEFKIAEREEVRGVLSAEKEVTRAEARVRDATRKFQTTLALLQREEDSKFRREQSELAQAQLQAIREERLEKLKAQNAEAQKNAQVAIEIDRDLRNALQRSGIPAERYNIAQGELLTIDALKRKLPPLAFEYLLAYNPSTQTFIAPKQIATIPEAERRIAAAQSSGIPVIQQAAKYHTNVLAVSKNYKSQLMMLTAMNQDTKDFTQRFYNNSFASVADSDNPYFISFRTDMQNAPAPLKVVLENMKEDTPKEFVNRLLEYKEATKDLRNDDFAKMVADHFTKLVNSANYARQYEAFGFLPMTGYQILLDAPGEKVARANSRAYDLTNPLNVQQLLMVERAKRFSIVPAK
jgi:hypothetical protein